MVDQNEYKLLDYKDEQPHKYCPLMGGKVCKGRFCAFARERATEFEFEYVAESNGIIEYKTERQSWLCSAIREVDIEVDSRATEWGRPLPVETQ